MDFDSLYSVVVGFLYAHKYVVLIIGVVFGLFFWKKPGKAFSFSVFIVGMAIVLYLPTLLGGTLFQGVDNKADVTTKTESQL